ncbi:uncharacterized protein LOC127799698 [Diospyros lotus]|uniref:uncharacterized protein LOC127799698 n=1 Tax=Diospyros lotus TaxID=55363 RepID=UPI0022542B11|nr:uncharacterized protein LOC127799698 [Diospyros lotus]
MRGRESKAPLPPPAPADLLVCFPPKAHFTLMPKPIRSPVRPSQPAIAKRHHFLKKLRSNGSIIGSDDIADEPTSPRVTCAGQIKVARRKPPSCKTWQSVMEEIERLHDNHTKSKKRPTWVESLGFKRDTAQFLACLERVRLDFRCFGSFSEADVASDDGEEVGIGDDGDDNRQVYDGNDDSSRAVFSKWLMLLQEDDELNHTLANGENYGKSEKAGEEEEPLHREIDKTGAPPPNALLLMRCRSAPAESRELEEDEEEIPSSMLATEEEKGNSGNKSLELLMRFDGIQEFCKISTEIAKETWVGGGGGGGGGDFPFSRN